MSVRKISTGAVIGLAAIGIILTLITTGAILSTQQISSTGTVASTVDVGVYTDSACTTNCTSISWGTLAPGATVTRTVYVKNLGTLPETLDMTTSGWNPANANGPITFTWNRASYVLNASQSVSATLTLAVSSSINSSITNFSFNIIISGTG